METEVTLEITKCKIRFFAQFLNITTKTREMQFKTLFDDSSSKSPKILHIFLNYSCKKIFF